MAIQEKIKGELKEAMLAKDQVRLTTVRGLLSAFVNELVAKGKKPDEPIPDEDALAVIKRSVKQRKDSIEQFTKGGRPELAEAEKAELVILEAYLPKMMSLDEIRPTVEAKIKEMGITDLPAQAGKSRAGMLIGAVAKELKGKADGADIKAVVDSLLQ